MARARLSRPTNTPVAPAQASCSALANTDGPLQAVLFNETQFVSNLCEPPGLGAGASLFWDQQYSVDIICPGSINPNLLDSSQPATNSSGASVAATAAGASCPQGTQQFCSQCLRIEGCAAWSGNRGSLLESARYAQMQIAPLVPALTGTSSLLAASVPLMLRRRRHGQSAAMRSRDVSPTATPASRTLLQDGSAVPVVSGAGLGSGPVALSPKQPSIAQYAAGSLLNVSVQVRQGCCVANYYDYVTCTSLLQRPLTCC